jgi:hypothetical protein
MSSIEAIPQPRIDVLVTAADGSGRLLRRTEYRGTVWYGGRPNLTPRARPGREAAPSGISTPFWVPDSLAYLVDGTGSAVVTASIGLQSVQGGAQVVDVGAALHPHPGRAGNSYVLFSLQAFAAVPIGLSYQVVVIVDADRVAD